MHAGLEFSLPLTCWSRLHRWEGGMTIELNCAMAWHWSTPKLPVDWNKRTDPFTAKTGQQTTANMQARATACAEPGSLASSPSKQQHLRCLPDLQSPTTFFSVWRWLCTHCDGCSWELAGGPPDRQTGVLLPLAAAPSQVCPPRADAKRPLPACRGPGFGMPSG